MPRSKSLYGSLNSQLQDPDSFASQLQKILAVRRAYDIAASRQYANTTTTASLVRVR